MNEPSAAKTGDDSIPLEIYQTWHSKKLPPRMQYYVDDLKSRNPEFRHHLFDDKDCEDFIKTHFDEEVVNSYRELIPGAYKADLWRYCVLYVHGGIYLDIKYHCMGDFRLIHLADREYFGHDPSFPGVMNNFMVCRPKNEKLRQCIEQIVLNVRNRHYGQTSLETTGPLLLARYFSEEEKLQFNMLFHYADKGRIMEIRFYKNRDIYLNGCYQKFNINRDPDAFEVILAMYPEYLSEKKKYQKNGYYSKLWKRKKIFRSDLNVLERAWCRFLGKID